MNALVREQGDILVPQYSSGGSLRSRVPLQFDWNKLFRFHIMGLFLFSP